MIIRYFISFKGFYGDGSTKITSSIISVKDPIREDGHLRSLEAALLDKNIQARRSGQNLPELYSIEILSLNRLE